MKVVFFNFGPLEFGGGFEKYLIDLANILSISHKDLEIKIITLDKNINRKLQVLLSFYYLKKADFSVLEKVPTSEVLKKLNKKIKYKNCNSFTALKKELKKCNLIFSKNEILDTAVLSLIGYKKLPPVIVSCGTPIFYSKANSFRSKLHNFLYTSFFYKLLNNGVAAFQAKNSLDQKKLKKLFPNKKIVKILNPLDIDKFKNKVNKFEFQLNTNQQKTNILWIGRFTEQKGIKELNQVITRTNKLYFDKLTWHIIGDTGDVNYIDNLVKEQKNVIKHGYVQNDFIPSILKQSDLLLTTSLWEGCPNNVMEAQAMNIPVCGFDIPGVNDIVINNKTGVLCEDLVSMEKNLKKFISKKYKFKNIEENARNKFDTEKIDDQFYKLFNEYA